VLAIGPRHPVVGELSQALNKHFRTRTEEARQRADRSRRNAQGAQASGQPAFAEAEAVFRDALSRLEAGEFVEATRGFSEAADSYERAQRDAEATRAAQARAAEAARLAAATRPTAVPPPPATPGGRAAERVGGVAPALPPSSLPPVTAAPVTAPPAAAAPPVLPSAAPALPGAGAERAVLRVLDDFERAQETGDLALYKSVVPGISSDQEKTLRESFKLIKSRQVELSEVSIEWADGRATVTLTRQDTLNGKVQKPRQQTLRLAQHGGSWVIESMGN
jgi:hypothetical protein